MLTLSRRTGEKIIIGDNIEICVVGIRRDRVVIGIAAPRDVPVYREELLPIREDNSDSAPVG